MKAARGFRLSKAILLTGISLNTLLLNSVLGPRTKPSRRSLTRTDRASLDGDFVVGDAVVVGLTPFVPHKKNGDIIRSAAIKHQRLVSKLFYTNSKKHMGTKIQ